MPHFIKEITPIIFEEQEILAGTLNLKALTHICITQSKINSMKRADSPICEVLGHGMLV